MKRESWFNGPVSKLFSMKYLAFLVSLVLLFIGVFAIFLGIKKVIEAADGLLTQEIEHPGVLLIEAVDTLLFALVVLILAGGIYKLFVGDDDTFKQINVLSKLKSFKDLKVLLWETLLLTLTVWAALTFFLDEVLSYEQLILPGSILLLALALRIIKDGKSHSKEDSD